jgi:hypothetical protein
MNIIESKLKAQLQRLTKSNDENYNQVISYITDGEVDKLMSFIKEKNFNFNHKYGTSYLALEYAFYHKDEVIINALLTCNVDLNYEDKSTHRHDKYPILATASLFDPKMFQKLIDLGMKVNNKTAQNCLQNCLMNYNLEMAKVLILNGTNYKKLSYSYIPHSMQVEIKKVIEEIEIIKEKEKLENIFPASNQLNSKIKL